MPSSRRSLLSPALVLATCTLLPGSSQAQQPQTIHFVHGRWFDGQTFVTKDMDIRNGILERPSRPGPNTVIVDLRGQFVVPPYGDAHEHNFDGLFNTPKVSAQYIADGIFYAQGMTDTTEGAAAVKAAKLVNTPSTPDVTYAHGGLTGVNGHPKEVYESLVLGFYYPATPEQRAQVIASHEREGKAYWEIATAEQLDQKWPKILASHPDLIKVYLLSSERFAQATEQQPRLAEGIDPALVPLIVARSHAAGLKVAAHIDTATDFHVAVAAGVDEMGHMPGYGMSAKEDPAVYRLRDEDIALAAAHGVKVQATAGIATDEQTPAADAAARSISQKDNLKRLKAAGVPVLVGSDHYNLDAVHEADYLQALGVWSNAEMLRMWSTTTPQAIFPRRKVGCLQPGCEASFLVLQANPLQEWKAAHNITDRWKNGEHLALPIK